MSSKNTNKKKRLVTFKFSISSKDLVNKFEFVKESLKKEFIAKGIVKPYKYLYDSDFGSLMILKLYEYYKSSEIQALLSLKEEQRDVYIKQMRLDI